MHARQLVELAGWVASHGQELLENGDPLPETGLRQYWMASKCRLDRWKRYLRGFEVPQSTGSSPSQASLSSCNAFQYTSPEDASATAFRKIKSVSRRIATLEEILLSEMLTRVWAVLMEAYDRRCGIQEAGALARSVFLEHLQARHRVLGLLLQPDEELLPQVDRLNQLRSHAERWTDLLLGALADLVEIKDFVFDKARAKDYAGDFSSDVPPPVREQAWRLTLGSLRRAFASGLEPTSANPDLNEAVAQAVFDCFPHAIRLHSPLEESLWQMRIVQCTSELQELVHSLWAEEHAS